MSLPDTLKTGIRQSHMSLAHACMRRLYFYLYVGPSKPNYFKAAGSAGHQALEYNFREKLRTGQDESPSNVTDFFVSAFDDRLKEDGLHLDQEPARVKDKIAYEALPLFMRQEAPTIDPDFVEEPFKIQVKDIEVPITGTLDLLTKQGGLQDFKFRPKRTSVSPNEVNKDFQLATYEIAAEARGKKVKEVTQTQIFCNPVYAAKVKPIRQTVAMLNPDSVLDEYAGIVRFVDKADGDPELYPMTDPANWWCSDSYCGWHSICPRFGGSHK